MELILEAIRCPEQASCSRVQALTLLYEYCDTAAKPFFALKERLQIFSNMCTTRFFNTLRDVLRATHCAASLTLKDGENASVIADNMDRESRILVARILRRVLDQKQMECRKYILEVRGETLPPRRVAFGCSDIVLAGEYRTQGLVSVRFR